MLAFVATIWLLMSPTLTGWALRTWFADARHHDSAYVGRMRRTAQRVTPRPRAAAPSVVWRSLGGESPERSELAIAG
jgi:hypothetical protein